MGDTIFTLTGDGSSGGSTGFSDVAEGTNTITVKQTSTTASVSVGSLGSFQKNNSYAVNVRNVSGSYCAELWQRLNTDSSFNNDTTRVLISTTCGGSSSPTTLASWSGGIYFFGIAVDPTNVYFADYSSSGTINKVAKE